MASYDMLQAKLGADARGSTLLPFIQPSASDHRLAAPENRHTLQCLASSGPVSQFLRPQAAPIIRRLLQVGQQLCHSHCGLCFPAGDLLVVPICSLHSSRRHQQTS